MEVLELVKTVGLIIAAPSVGVVILVIIYSLSKPEEKRTTENLTFLSSKGTSWLKRKMPMFACPVIATVAAAFAIKTFPNSPTEFKVVESIIIAVLLFIPFMFCGLKEVGYSKDSLYVSNLSSSILVPFTDIEKIWAKYTGRSGWFIFISFKNKTRYGRKIYFLPYIGEGILLKGDEHPVVIELKNIVQRSAAQ